MSTRTIYGIAIGLVVIVAGLWATYQYGKDRLGAETAKVLYFKNVVSYFSIAGLLLLIGVSVEADSVVAILVPGLMILGIVVQLIRIMRNPVKDQPDGFDLTPANQFQNGESLAFVILGGIAVIGGLVVLFRDGGLEIRYFAMGGLCLALSAYFAAYNTYAHTFITKEGVSKGSAVVPWDQIERRYWGKDQEDSVLLVLQRGGPFSALRHLEIKVPTNKKKETEKFLRGMMSGR